MAGLALIFGKGKPKSSDDDAEESDDGEEYEEDEVPPDFESYAVEAFPELEDDSARTMAFWKAVKACVEA